MPVQSCTINGKPGYKAGPNAKCYPYTAGNKTSRDAAYSNAVKQLQAIKARCGKLHLKTECLITMSIHIIDMYLRSQVKPLFSLAKLTMRLVEIISNGGVAMTPRNELSVSGGKAKDVVSHKQWLQCWPSIEKPGDCMR